MPDALTLHWPPSVNRYWRHVGARVLISREGRAYTKAVAELALLADRSAWPLSGRLRVEIELYPPDRRRRDIDNCAKAILDALQKAGVYVDDCQIDELLIVRREKEPGGRAVVSVRRRDSEAALHR